MTGVELKLFIGVGLESEGVREAMEVLEVRVADRGDSGAGRVSTSSRRNNDRAEIGFCLIFEDLQVF